MGILNRTSDGLPSVLVAVLRLLHGRDAMEREKLQALLAPKSLVDSPKQVRQTLNRWVQIGLFTEEDGRVGLTSTWSPSPDAGIPGQRALFGYLRDLLLAPSNNEDLVKPKPRAGTDFVRALCWALTLDVYRPLDSATALSLDSAQFKGPLTALENSTRWDGFADWAPLLGFAWVCQLPSTNSLVLDPTPAVQACLPGIFGDRKELDQATFFTALAQALPVVDRGDYRQKVEEQLQPGTWTRTEDHQVSPSLSRALIRLEVAGRLVLHKRADGVHRTLLGRGFIPHRDVSHVTLGDA